MFQPFLAHLRAAGVPVSLREYLSFLEALKAGLVIHDTEGFYHLARVTLVKDERHLDRFDQAFAQSFAGLEDLPAAALLAAIDLPPDWLEARAERVLSAEERARIAAQGGFAALMAALRDRLSEQQGRHEGGSRWIGTAGTSPFGAQGDHPEGVRIGQEGGRRGRAAKIWDRREFRDLDDRAEIGTRNIKLALKRLRRWARDGAVQELDLDGTIRATAEHGWLDVQTRPERRNGVKVVLFLDTGGSMDAHVSVAQQLFSAARAEFRHLEHYCFHNCLYEAVWRDNRRRREARVPTLEVIHRLAPDTKCLFVGDAAMSPYEITHAGGASEHWNAEPGALWLARARARWPASAWLNPLPEAQWGQTRSVRLIRGIFEDRMFPLTLEGLTAAMKALGR